MVSSPEETSGYLIKSMSAYIIKESRLVELCLLFYYTHFRSIVLNVLKDTVKILQTWKSFIAEKTWRGTSEQIFSY